MQNLFIKTKHEIDTGEIKNLNFQDISLRHKVMTDAEDLVKSVLNESFIINKPELEHELQEIISTKHYLRGYFDAKAHNQPLPPMKKTFRQKVIDFLKTKTFAIILYVLSGIILHQLSK